MSLHPIIVHFSIALLLVSVLFDFLAIFRSQSFLRGSALYLLVLGVFAGVGAGITGNDAFQELSPSSEKILQVQSHADFGTGTIWLSLLLLIFRFHLAIRGRFMGGFRAAYLVLSLIVAGLLSITGYLGGRLVFEHGIGVRMTSPSYSAP